MSEKKTRLNIVWLATWYPNRFDAFDGDFIQRQAWAAQIFNNITVLALVPSPVKNYEISVRKNKITEICILVPDTRNAFLKSVRLLRALRIGWKQIIKLKLEKPDLIHANIIGAASVSAFILSRFLKIPFIITEHWSGPLALRRKTAYGFARRTAQKARAVIVLSEVMKNLMRERGIQNNFYTVPNVVDTEMFSLKEKNNSSTFKWLHVSSLRDDIKNVTGILKAFAKLQTTGENIRLDIFGGGGDEERLEKSAAVMNLLNTGVFFHGIQTHDKIAQAMSQSDALIMNSRREGLPCVILEAMSCGLPIVSTDVGGISEWVTTDVGILFQSEDAPVLENAITELMRKKNDFSPENIRSKIIQMCSYEKVGFLLNDIYRKIIAT